MKSKAFLAVLVALAMLVSFGLSVKDAKADAILFPWVVKSSAVSTLISVVNTAEYKGNNDFDPTLHYQYWYKKTTDNKQSEICENESFEIPTSQYDIITFDAAGNIGEGKALFNDPSPYGKTSLALSAPAPRRAFLIVDNNTKKYQDGSNVEGTLYGEAMVLEIAGGAAWGYVAMPASTGQARTSGDPVSFGLSPKVLDSGNYPQPTDVAMTTFLPPNNACTKFFITPIDLTDQRQGNLAVGVQLLKLDNGKYDGGLYDNDENPFDSKLIKTIVCTSADPLSAFITSGIYTRFVATGGKGWSFVRTLKGSGSGLMPTNAAVIGKLEYTTGGMTIDGKAIPGTFNNFTWLEPLTPATPNATDTGCPCP